MEEIDYFQARVMRHIADKGVEYAMHDVYFAKDDTVVTYTEHARSPRAPTVSVLIATLDKMSMSDASAFICGDLGYTHDHDDIAFWLEGADKPVIDYAAPGNSKANAITFNSLDRALYPHTDEEYSNAPPIDPNTLFPLPLWYYQVGDTPLEELTVRDLCIACRQGTHLTQVVPLALEVLQCYPLAGEKYDGELARALRSIRPRDWENMPGHQERLMQILRGAQARYEDIGDNLKPELIRQ